MQTKIVSLLGVMVLGLTSSAVYADHHHKIDQGTSGRPRHESSAHNTQKSQKSTVKHGKNKKNNTETKVHAGKKNQHATKTASKPQIPYHQRKDVQAFIAKLVKEDNFKREHLEKLFATAVYQDRVIHTMQRPYEAKPWHFYKNFFISDRRLNEGVAFWKAHKKDLARAQQQFGVPAKTIVAILGIETEYGRHLGNYPVFDTLVTLGFDYPSRAPFFQNELREYLLLTRELHFNPHDLRGSYAGAMGEPQFMPSSYRHYAIDFDHHGTSDLLHNPTDAIGSIANYLKLHGWHENGLITLHAKIAAAEKTYQKLKHKGFKPSISTQQLKKNHIQTKQHIGKKEKATLLRFEEAKDYDYWLGFQNFYVLTRYNVSQNYAMVVYQMGEMIEDRYKHQHHSRHLV